MTAEEETKKKKKKSILTALCTALLWWIVLYIVATHLMVMYQWSDVNHVEYNNTIVEITIPSEPVIVEQEEIIEVDDDTFALDDDTKERNKDLLRELGEQQSNQVGHLDKLESSVDLLVHNVGKVTDYPKVTASTGASSSSLTSLKNLLNLQTLAKTKDKDLQIMLEKALHEIEETTGTGGAAVGLDFLQQSSFARDAREDSAPADCPPPPPAQDGGARQSEFTALVSKINHALDEQRKGKVIDSILEDIGVHVMDKELDGLELPIVIEVEQQPESSTVEQQQESDNNDNDRICLMEDDLLDMIHVATTAKDLRRALMQLVKDLEPESNLILDAPLPVSSYGDDDKATPTTTPTTLRQALNSEWFWYASTATIDGILDVTSGYNDMLDSRLDALLLNNQDENSVGRVIVGRFLELLGSTTLPTPIAKLYNDTQAGMLSQV